MQPRIYGGNKMWIICDCDTCNMQGEHPEEEWEPCPDCDGWGFVPQEAHPLILLDQTIDTFQSREDAFAMIQECE